MQTTTSRRIWRSILLSTLCISAQFWASPPGSHLGAAGGPSAIPRNADDKVIVHVLNRLGFGAAPGDVERVRQIGLEKYIDSQLHPESMSDSTMAARLSGLDTLDKSSRDLAEDYFVPALMERRKAQQQAAPQPADSVTGKRDMRTPEQMQLM